MKTREEALTMMVQSLHSMVANMNEVFYHGADCESIEGSDALDLVEEIQLHGWDAINAYVSLRRELIEGQVVHPIEMDEDMKSNYDKARESIEKQVKDSHSPMYSDLKYRAKEFNEEIEIYGERVFLDSQFLEGQKYGTMIAYLKKAGISGTGQNINEAMKDLEHKFKQNKALKQLSEQI